MCQLYFIIFSDNIKKEEIEKLHIKCFVYKFTNVDNVKIIKRICSELNDDDIVFVFNNITKINDFNENHIIRNFKKYENTFNISYQNMFANIDNSFKNFLSTKTTSTNKNIDCTFATVRNHMIFIDHIIVFKNKQKNFTSEKFSSNVIDMLERVSTSSSNPTSTSILSYLKYAPNSLVLFVVNTFISCYDYDLNKKDLIYGVISNYHIIKDFLHFDADNIFLNYVCGNNKSRDHN